MKNVTISMSEELARLSYLSRSGSDISGGGRDPSRDAIHDR
jgi:hypothetical protein